jgi:hypothetical protein
VPTNTDWNTLSTFLGGNTVSGGKMKSIGTQYWLSPNTGATNQSGLSALPAGWRSELGTTFSELGAKSMWWSATQVNTSSANRLRLDNTNANIVIGGVSKRTGQSVRCVRNVVVGSRFGDEENTIISDGLGFDNVQLFPNPASNTINLLVQASSNGDAVVHLYDLLGQSLWVKNENLSEVSNSLMYNISDLSSGVYFLHIKQGTAETILKLTKE